MRQFHTNLGRHVYKCLHQAACLSVSYQPGAACVQMLTSGSLFISFIPTWGGMCTNAYIRQLVYQFHTNLGRHVYKCLHQAACLSVSYQPGRHVQMLHQAACLSVSYQPGAACVQCLHQAACLSVSYQPGAACVQMLTSGSLFISFIPTWGGMCTNAYIRQLVYQFHTNLGRHVYKCLHQAACLSVSYQLGAACVQMLTSGSLFISFIPTWGGMCTNAYIRQLVYQFHTNLGRHVYKCLHQAACLSVSYQPGAACVQMLTSGSLFISFIPTWGGMCTNAYIRQLVYQFHTNLGRHVYKCSRSMLNDPKVVPASCPMLVDVTALDQLAFESTV
ncbi:hypothetical protein J6590_095351 [Homalodisca vitripennis]|nr:hypothetical protein J6590_095351 [Homalodisca vitripennis]